MPKNNTPTVEQLTEQVAWLRRQLAWVHGEVGKFDAPVATAIRVILADPQGGGEGR